MKFFVLFTLAFLGTASACKTTAEFEAAAEELLTRAANGKRQYVLGEAPNFEINKSSVRKLNIHGQKC